MTDNLLKALQSLNIGDLKNLVNYHNLATHIKVKQTKPNLIKALLRYYTNFNSAGTELLGIPNILKFKYDINPRTGKARALRKSKEKTKSEKKPIKKHPHKIVKKSKKTIEQLDEIKKLEKQLEQIEKPNLIKHKGPIVPIKASAELKQKVKQHKEKTSKKPIIPLNLDVPDLQDLLNIIEPLEKPLEGFDENVEEPLEALLPQQKNKRKTLKITKKDIKDISQLNLDYDNNKIVDSWGDINLGYVIDGFPNISEKLSSYINKLNSENVPIIDSFLLAFLNKDLIHKIIEKYGVQQLFNGLLRIAEHYSENDNIIQTIPGKGAEVKKSWVKASDWKKIVNYFM